MSTETKSKAQQIQEYQAQCNGTDNWYKHFTGMIYTDGAKFVAEICGAYWLIDLIASHQKGKVRDETFQLWIVTSPESEGKPWIVEAWTDTPHSEGSVMLARQEIQYSDFPRELSPFKLYCENGTLCFPEER